MSVSSIISDYLSRKAIIDLKARENKRGKFVLTIFTNSTGVGRFLNTIVRFFAKTLKTSELGEVFYRLDVDFNPGENYYKQVAKAIKVMSELYGNDWASIKKKGPAIFYANHPLGGVDAFVLASELAKSRPDIKVLFTSVLENVPRLKDYAFILKIIKGHHDKEHNKMMLAQVNEHLAEGKSILVFPAGSISTWRDEKRTFAMDIDWKESFIRFAEKSPEVSFYPIYVEGEPSVQYLRLRQRSLSLSNAYVLREFANQIGTTMRFHLGDKIVHKDIAQFTREDQVSYLRAKVYSMGTNFFRQQKVFDLSLGEEYSLETPLITNGESGIMRMIDSKINPDLD